MIDIIDICAFAFGAGLAFYCERFWFYGEPKL